MFNLICSENINLFYVKFKSEVTLNDVIGFYKELEVKTSQHYEKNINLISDYRSSFTNGFKTKDLKLISEYCNSNILPKFNNIKWAFISDKPLQVAASIIFSKQISASNLEYSQFTTLNAALHWLHLKFKNNTDIIKPDEYYSGQIIINSID